MSQSQQPPSDTPASPARPEQIEKVQRDQAGRLVIHLKGRSEPLRDVRVARCFPWTLPDQYISVRTSEGKEVLLLESLDDLEVKARERIERELREKVFNPRIQRVLDFSDDFGVVSITAQTDRGEVTFQIRSRDDVRVLGPSRALLRDADGNVYELADMSALDSASRAYLSRYF